MSSKKALRKQRRKAEKEEEKKKGMNPALLFILAIGVAVLVTLGVSFAVGGSSAPGDPPWPGAVWSDAHGHWH